MDEWRLGPRTILGELDKYLEGIHGMKEESLSLFGITDAPI